MPKAAWNGAVIAESDDSSAASICPWKGSASYYDVVVDGRTNAGAAWYYSDPKPEAARIKDRVAFWKGVSVES